jgi:hypothetical protein
MAEPGRERGSLGRNGKRPGGPRRRVDFLSGSPVQGIELIAEKANPTAKEIRIVFVKPDERISTESYAQPSHLKYSFRFADPD